MNFFSQWILLEILSFISRRNGGKKVVTGKTLEDGTINPYTIRFICKNGTEINCTSKFTDMNDKQHSNNTAT